MPTIKVRVSGKIAENLTPEVKIVCGNEDYQVEFDFDEPWQGTNFKTGLFIYNGKLVAQPFDGAVCPMPIIENTTLLAIGVKTSDGELYTTTPAYADCLKSASDLATNKIPAPSKDVYDEIIALLNKYISGVGSIDLSDYQKKVDDGLETTDKTVVGAINEVKVLAEAAKMVFGETEGTAYEGNKGKANADNIVKLKNELAIVNVALEQSGLVKKYKQPIEQEYNERVTADGANVLDGSKAVLKKVVGSTVRCENLTPFPYVEKSTTKNGITFTVNNDGSITLNGTATALATFILADKNTLNLIEGKTYCISSGTKVIFAYKTETGNSVYKNGLDNRVIEWKEGYKTPQFYLQVGSGLTVNETIYPMLNEGSTAKPYQPYFTGLKSASFGGIESTNADRTETSTLDFPKTPTPLGTTIDFENKKIVELCNEDTIDGVSKVFEKASDNWIRTGFFSFAVHQALSQNGYGLAFKSNLFVATQGFKQGQWEWNALSFEKGTERYLLAGNNSAIAFFTMPNADLGILETDTDEVKLQAARTWLENNPVVVRYLLATPTETPFTEEQKAVGKKYLVQAFGTEKVIDNDGTEYGADNTLTQNYILVAEVD